MPEDRSKTVAATPRGSTTRPKKSKKDAGPTMKVMWPEWMGAVCVTCTDGEQLGLRPPKDKSKPVEVPTKAVQALEQAAGHRMRVD